MNLVNNRQDYRCKSDVLDCIIKSQFVNLPASLSVKVVTELQVTIETMFCVTVNPVTNERHIPHQIVISWNVKLHVLYITLFVDIRYSGINLTIHANSQSGVENQLLL